MAKHLSTAVVNFNANGDNIVIAGVVNKKIYVYRWLLGISGATNLTIKDGATAKSGPFPMAANGTFTLDNTEGSPWYWTSTGNDFVINQSGSATIGGTIYYSQY